MKTKTGLIYLLSLLSFSIFSFRAVYAQKEIAGMLASSPQRSYSLPTLLLSSYDNHAYNKGIKQITESKEFYLQRNNNQKKAGWILLGAGTAIAVIGGIGFASNFDINLFTPVDPAKNQRADIFGAIMLAGIVTDLISIPFFISAHHNKKRAASLSFGNQNLNFPGSLRYSQNAVPTVNLSVKF
jgi:hypothetical protein